MMRIYQKDMHQDISLWRSNGDYEFGEPSYQENELIKGRWQYKAVAYINREGEQSVSRAIVYLNTLVAVDDVIALGLFSFDNPREVPTAQRVVNLDISPSLKANEYLVKAYV